MNKNFNICIVGAGTIGTALAHVLAEKESLHVQLLSIEEDVVNDINALKINTRYFPQIRLNPRLTATIENGVLRSADVVFLGIPSGAVVPFIQSVKDQLNPSALLINLAKGFGTQDETIIHNLRKVVENPVCTLKGPTFARDIINHVPSAMTLGADDESIFLLMNDIFDTTSLHLDYTKDIIGVEMLSILKNIYAITIGIVDAHFDSPNLRFMVFTNAFNEMRSILLKFGGKQETMFRYCGIGDFGLTSLNDLSRNRTLGLLIGKGFFSDDISGKVVLEGRIAAGIISERLKAMQVPESEFFMLNELNKIFQGGYDVKRFISNLLSNKVSPMTTNGL